MSIKMLPARHLDRWNSGATASTGLQGGWSGCNRQTLSSPIRLEAGPVQQTRHEPYRLLDHGDGYVLQAHVRGEWQPLYTFTTAPRSTPDSRKSHVQACAGRPYSVDVSVQPNGRDRLRELLDAVVDADNAGVGAMARSSYTSEFHFSREVRRLTGEPPAALRRRVMLERAAWRLQHGEGVAEVAAAEGWSSAEVFSRAFRRAFGVPPSRAGDVGFRLSAPNGVHFHPPQSLWCDGQPGLAGPDIAQFMLVHDVADTEYLIEQAASLTETQWKQEVSPGQVVLDWDGPEPSVAAVLAAIVWTKEVWLATIEGQDFPSRTTTSEASVVELAAHHNVIGKRWTTVISEYAAAGRLADTVIDALCDPPESFQLYGIVAHVLTYSAHRRALARAMLARHGVETHRGDPLEWMREDLA